MARERSASRDSRTYTTVVMRLLGVSIALCCVVSFAQLSSLVQMSESVTVRSSTALRTNEHALVLAVKNRPDVTTEPVASTAARPAPVRDAFDNEPTAAYASPSVYSIQPHSENATTKTHEHVSSLISSAVDNGRKPSSTPGRTTPLLPLTPESNATDANGLRANAPALVEASRSSSRRIPVPSSSAASESVHEPHAPPTLALSTAAPVSAPITRTFTSKPTPKPTRAGVRIPEPRVHIERGSRGVVLCLYERIVPLGVSLIRELRCLGNTERIEVFHCSELSAASVALLHAVDTNVRVLDACRTLVDRGVFGPALAHTFRSYWLKPLAVHQTTLEELILLDADDVLLHDPAVLRTTPGYRTNGTLFFYDRVVRQRAFFNSKDALPVRNATTGAILHSSRTASKKKPKRVRHLKHWVKTFDYARFGLAPQQPSAHLLASFAYRGKTCHEQDSSMLLLHKRGAAKAMEVLWFLITEERFVYDFSWGDKEAFWLAYEFSHTPYFFSPWGASVVSSAPNDDLARHPRTLCGSLAHYMPLNDSSAPALLYVNGKALIDPVPFDVNNTVELRANQVFNILPTHVTPRQVRTTVARPEQGRDYVECLTDLGAEPAPPELRGLLWRRRLHFLAVSMGMLEQLTSCSVGGGGTATTATTTTEATLALQGPDAR